MSLSVYGFADSIKEKLDVVLTEMQEYSWLFVNNPEKDFTRNRKLDFKEMLNILLSMASNSLKLELMKYFSYEVETATSSAFIQQREKILPEALEFLFLRVTSSLVNPNYYDGYRMLAVDGLQSFFLTVNVIATQNVSRLHALAGSKNVYELHGNI